MKKISIATSALVFALAAAGGASAKAPTRALSCPGPVGIPCKPLPPSGNVCVKKIGIPCRPLPPVKK